ncbi:hypothetical protein YC2023_030663 [Brassica napus]
MVVTALDICLSLSTLGYMTCKTMDTCCSSLQQSQIIRPTLALINAMLSSRDRSGFVDSACNSNSLNCHSFRYQFERVHSGQSALLPRKCILMYLIN